MRREQTDNKNEASAEPDEEPPVQVESNNKNKTTTTTIISTAKNNSSDPTIIRKLTPPSKKAMAKQNNQNRVEKVNHVKSGPIAAPRTGPTPYQPARLADSPNEPERRNSWIQTVKRYN